MDRTGILLTAIWNFFTGLGAGIAMLLLLAGQWLYQPVAVFPMGVSHISMGLPNYSLLFLTFGFIGFLYGLLGLAAGIGLLMRKEWGRITAIIHAVVSLPAFPVGTVIGILVLLYLTKNETKQYFSTNQ